MDWPYPYKTNSATEAKYFKSWGGPQSKAINANETGARRYYCAGREKSYHEAQRANVSSFIRSFQERGAPARHPGGTKNSGKSRAKWEQPTAS